MATDQDLVRGKAAFVLDAIGPDAHAAISALNLHLSSTNETLRLAASEALKRIEPLAPIRSDTPQRSESGLVGK